jgi:hypothetical protein
MSGAGFDTCTAFLPFGEDYYPSALKSASIFRHPLNFVFFMIFDFVKS